MKRNEQTAVTLGKFAALAALLAFLLMPQVGCGNITFKGWELAANRYDDWFVTVTAWIGILACMGAFSSRKATSILGFGILGLLATVGGLLKAKPWASDLFGVEIKPGAFVTITGYLATIFAGWWGLRQRRASGKAGGVGKYS